MFFTGCASQEIRIGAITSLTGDNASIGIEFQRVVNLAVTNINKTWAENGKTLSIQWEDGECEKDSEEIALQKLVENDQLALILEYPCFDNFHSEPFGNQGEDLFQVKMLMLLIFDDYSYYEIPDFISESDFTLRLQNAYREVYGQEIQDLPTAAFIYTEIYRLSIALDEEGMNPEKIKEALGTFSIDENSMPF